MRLQKVENSQPVKKMLDCKLSVRKDLTVVKASEWYYEYVGEYSPLPISSLLEEEDGELLEKCVSDLEEPIEIITRLYNRKGKCKNIYLRMEKSDETEDGNALLKITMFDIRDMEERTAYLERDITKYRHFMSLNDEYYFDYSVETDIITLYKYINERAMQLMNATLDEFVENMDREHSPTGEQKEQMRVFVAYLRAGSSSFEMEFTMHSQEGESVCRVKGGRLYKYTNMVVGIMRPNQIADNEAYYLTPAARDAGTGLLNKKAVTEYTVGRLQLKDGNTRWFILLDIDDFKNINDTYGHLFGDKVISRVADILQFNVGFRGIVGRFGGDEFYIFLEKVPDRAAVKILIKTIVKEMAYAFDPQLKVTASIGIVRYPEDGEDYETLFSKADRALYVAKEKGKNRHIIYDEKLHGSANKDDMKSMTVAYAVSRVKRREAMVEVLNNVYAMGIQYVVEHPQVLKKLRELFDLDGITIYTDYGKKLLCRSGDYMSEAPKEHWGLMNVKYSTMFGEDDMIVESGMTRLKANYPELYQRYAKQEVGAFIQCISRKDGIPFAAIHFEVFNRNRKWSDTEIEMLGVVGSCIGNLLAERAVEE